jgi:hypothetical protein
MDRNTKVVVPKFVVLMVVARNRKMAKDTDRITLSMNPNRAKQS